MSRGKRRSIVKRLVDFQTEIRRRGLRRLGGEARPADGEAKRQLERLLEAYFRSEARPQPEPAQEAAVAEAPKVPAQGAAKESHQGSAAGSQARFPLELRPKPASLLVELAFYEVWRKHWVPEKGTSDSNARINDAKRKAAEKKRQTDETERHPTEKEPQSDDDPEPETAAGDARPLP